MKKLLLLSLALGAASAPLMAQNIEPLLLENGIVTKLSPNGLYGAGQTYNLIYAYDFSTGEEFLLNLDEEAYFFLGIGNSISNDGTVALCISDTEPALWHDGTFYSLPLGKEPQGMNSAHAITPDGSRVCGNLGIAGMSYEGDVQMTAPIYWERLEDGTYSNPVRLPYPLHDAVGRVPQYVTAAAISEDGKTIAGQIVDAVGFLREPIVYTQNENGEWNYSLPCRDLINPNHLELPQYPGEAPVSPMMEPEKYMTEEEYEDYMVALSEWEWDQTLTEEENPYPQPQDYMSEEELNAFNEALAQYETDYVVWSNKYLEWADTYNQMVNESVNTVFNTVRISADGNYLAYAAETTVVDPTSWTGLRQLNTPLVFDLAKNDHILYTNCPDRTPAIVTNDGTVLATTVAGKNDSSYLLNGDEIQDVIAYMASKAPIVESWVNKEMTHEVSQFIQDPETGEWIETTTLELRPGHFTATPDLMFFASWAENVWNYITDTDSYYFDLQSLTGLNNVVAKTLTAPKACKGSILVPEGATVLKVYDLNGRVVFNANNPAHVVNPALSAGVYLIEAVDANGAKAVTKAIF